MQRFVVFLLMLLSTLGFAAEARQADRDVVEDQPGMGCTVQVDSVLSRRFPPENLFDGRREDPVSRWASSRAEVPHWVKITFKTPVTVDGMVVHGHDDAKGLALAAAAVQVPDGQEWKTLASVNDNRQTQVVFSWTQVETSVIRLAITQSCRADHTARLFEIDLRGGGAPIPLKVLNYIGTSPSSQSGVDRVEDEQLLAAVVPFAFDPKEVRKHSQRNQAMLQQYYDSIYDWSRLLDKHFQAVPEHPDWGYYGDGSHTENSVRPICYAAMTNAFLAEITPPAGGANETERETMRRQAVAALGYLTLAHQANDGTCLNGRPWGNQWQSAMWARSVGMAGWFLWERLDRSARLAVARVVEYEADRFLVQQPKSSLKNDTGAEENAWNAGLIALARCMMPRHPRSDDWDTAAKRYMYNTFSVVADADDLSPGDDGRPVCDWVTTVNAHEDFTVENHGLVHVGYLKNAHALLLEAATPYVLTRQSFPYAGRHHANDVFEILLSCVAWEGAPIYFGGNDWKLVHTQCSDVLSYALTNTQFRDPRAAHLESVALERLCQIQRQRGGYYTVRKDLEHNGFVASRLATCFLIHAQAGEGVVPLSEQQFEQGISGVRYLEHGQAILHRTPSKFASFAWGSKRMALAMPRNGNWVVWPHYASYLGLVNGKDPSEANATLTRLHQDVHPDHFSVTGTLQRSDGKITHDFAIASLQKDIVVYIERLRVKAGSRISARETGIVGHEYPLQSNTRTIFGSFGRRELLGLGNPEVIHELRSDWLNLGGRVGYIVRRQPERQNLMRYHDKTQGEGRVPKLQEWFSLVGDADPTSDAAGDDWACVVVFLNQTSDETAKWARRVRFQVSGDVATCQFGTDSVRADFARLETHITK